GAGGGGGDAGAEGPGGWRAERRSASGRALLAPTSGGLATGAAGVTEGGNVEPGSRRGGSRTAPTSDCGIAGSTRFVVANGFGDSTGAGNVAARAKSR